jgi:hypothetical protein
MQEIMDTTELLQKCEILNIRNIMFIHTRKHTMCHLHQVFKQLVLISTSSPTRRSPVERYSVQHTADNYQTSQQRHERKQVTCNMHLSMLCTSHGGGHSAKVDRKTTGHAIRGRWIRGETTLVTGNSEQVWTLSRSPEVVINKLEGEHFQQGYVM